jgi:hypothetical protein
MLLAHELTHVVQQHGPLRRLGVPDTSATGHQPLAPTRPPSQTAPRSPTSTPLIQCAITKTNQQERVHEPDLGLFEYTFDWQATAEHHDGYVVQYIDRRRELRDN